jgi:signal transduction histidine kinase
MAGLDGFILRIYERTRPNYVHLLLGLVVLGVQLVIIPIYAFLLLPIYGATVSQFVRTAIGFELATGIFGTLGLFAIALRRHATAIRWLRDDPQVPLTEAWSSAVLDAPWTVLLIVLWYSACALPPAIYTGTVLHFALLTELLYMVGLTFLIAGAGVFMFLFFELALRPVIWSVANELPADWQPPRRGVQMSFKLLFFLPAISLFNAMAVGAASTNSLDRNGRLAVIVTVALGLSATLALALNLMLRNAVLAPLGRLRSAMGAVAAGDLDVRLPPVSGDELDEVAAVFNRMTNRLRIAEREMRESRARIVVAADEARRRLERDLHDGAQQHLVLLRLKLGLLQRQLEADPALAHLAAELGGDVSNALAELRNLAHGIYPVALESEGLGAALAEVARTAPIGTSLEIATSGRYPPQIEAAVYFCCLEALQNAGKHAGQDAVAVVRLAEHDSSLTFEISDSGWGFAPSEQAASFGLQNMSDRIGALGGELSIKSAPGGGTRVCGRIPLPVVHQPLRAYASSRGV